jgi:xanthine dehydrogenase accessory factor
MTHSPPAGREIKSMTRPTVTERDPQDVLQTALKWRDAGKAVALATVVQTWGSSPRPTGSNLVIADDGSFEGSVSGGCVEGAVIAAAMDVIHNGEQRLLDFGVSDDEAWEVGLACGGQIEILVEPVE